MESVKPDFVYQSEGCGKTFVVNKRCDAPHSIQMHGTAKKPCIHPYKMKSAVRCPDYFENFHIFRLDSAKTLSYVYVAGTLTLDTTKVVIFSQQTSEQHPRSIADCNI